ncbi:unnamed protein product [Cuscuta campestris]|uniref:Uncharacterized protein n=1 Tax=Cuscuta campestris TaxID=132261 RepID=A0A484NIZ3_9ASTE|nr:unnamed protein product [Cuscuta campestris]
MEQLLQGTRWHRLLTMRAESSLPLTIEFLCSLELEPSTGSRSLNFQSVDSRTTLTFTLLGRGFQLTVADLATHLGLYTLEETSAPEFEAAPYLLPADVDPADFWAEHSFDPDRFEGMGRASQSMGNRMHIVCGFVVTILFRSLEGTAPIPRAQMMMRDLDAGMLRNAHIRRRLGASFLICALVLRSIFAGLILAVAENTCRASLFNMVGYAFVCNGIPSSGSRLAEVDGEVGMGLLVLLSSPKAVAKSCFPPIGVGDKAFSSPEKVSTEFSVTLTSAEEEEAWPASLHWCGLPLL